MGIDWRGKPHRYQIVWTTTSAQFYVDGTLMVTHASMGWGAVMMRPAIVDTTSGDAALAVDWIRMTPYGGPGSFTSAVFDAADAVLWQKLTATSTVPSGTTATFTYRTGNTPHRMRRGRRLARPAPGATLTGSSRYLQFAVQMTTTGAKSPVIQDVTVQFKR